MGMSYSISLRMERGKKGGKYLKKGINVFAYREERNSKEGKRGEYFEKENILCG